MIYVVEVLGINGYWHSTGEFTTPETAEERMKCLQQSHAGMYEYRIRTKEDGR